MFRDRVDWKKFEGYDWACWLEGHPDDADKCDWSKLDAGDWRILLMERPEFAKGCRVWDDMDDDDIQQLMRKRPELKPNFSKDRLCQLEERRTSDEDDDGLMTAEEFFGSI